MEKTRYQYNLKKKREEKGLTQLELAHKTGIALPSISRYESNQRVPNVFTAYLLAKALDSTMEDMVMEVANEVCPDETQ